MASHELCESCFLKDKTTHAVKLCTDCDERLCQECGDNHLGFKVFVNHHLVPLTSIPSHISTFDKYCCLHEDMILDFYCTHHNTVCCRMCLPETHKPCADILPIEVASKGVKKSSFLTETMDQLNNITQTLKTLIQTAESDMARLQNSRSSIIREIAKCKKELMQQIEDMERKLIKNITIVEKDLNLKLEKTKNYISKELTKTEERKQELQFLKKHGTNNQVFLALQKNEKEIETVETEIFKRISTYKEIEIFFERNNLKIDSLGNICQKTKPCSVQFTPSKLKQAQVGHSDMNTRPITNLRLDGEMSLKEDEDYFITDVAITSDNKMLLCNSKPLNPSVYIYSGCKTYENQLEFSSKPCRVAVLPDKERAVITLPDENAIQFINTKSARKGKKVTISFKACSVTASADIFIGSIDEFIVLDTNGVFQKKVSIPQIGSIDFIYYDKIRTRLLCRSNDKLCCVGSNERILYEYNASGVSGIAVDRQGDVYTGDYYSNIHRVSISGVLRGKVLTPDNGVNKPFALTFNSSFTKLFIVENYCSAVKVYSCS